MSEISRSYAAERMYPEGSKVSVNVTLKRNIPTDTSGPEWKWEPVTLEPGQTFQVMSYMNAGFRGIEVSLKMEDGRTVSGVSAGHLIAPFEAH